MIFHSDNTPVPSTSAWPTSTACGSQSDAGVSAGTTPWPSRSSPPSRPSCLTDAPGPFGPSPTRQSSTGSRAGPTLADDTPHWTSSARSLRSQAQPDRPTPGSLTPHQPCPSERIDSTPLTFASRPESIPGDLRLGWRLCAFVLVLDSCRAGTAYLEHVHLLMWAIRSAENRVVVSRWFDIGRMLDDPVVRYYPSTSRTTRTAVVGGLATWRTTQTVALTPKGRGLAREVDACLDRRRRLDHHRRC
jgi:hypothetical protein